MRILLALSVFAVGCAGPETRDVDEILARIGETARATAPAPDSLASLVDLAVRTHPRVLEARARAEAALARSRGAGALDDPMLFFTAEAVPLSNPSRIGRDEFNAVGLSQTVPLLKQGLREEVALAEARKAAEEARRTANDVAAEVKRAWADYSVALAERALHEKHAEIMTSFVSAAEVKYATGKVSQQDVLEGKNGLSMLHASLAESEARVEEAWAALKDLTGRDVPVPVLQARALAITPQGIETLAAAHRPDLRAAEAAVTRAEAALRLAARERWMPDLSVEAMVMQMPGEPDAWGGTVGFNLPWFSPKRKAEEAAAERELDAERRMLESVRRSARREIVSAHARLRAALRSHELQEKDLVPRARQNLEVARSNYEKEKIDFLRFLEAEQGLRSAELESARALAQVETSWADLEKAAGTPLGGER